MRTTTSRQWRSAIEASTTAGSFWTTSAASSATPSTRSATRRYRRSALSVEDEGHANQRERERPDPARQPTSRRRKTQLEPAPPARDDGQQTQRHVRDLDQVFLLQVQPRVRVGQQEPAADGAQERKDERRALEAYPVRPDQPLEDTERDHQEHEDAVLQHLRIQHALPEAQGPERPGPGVITDKHEACEAHEHQRPATRQ